MEHYFTLGPTPADESCVCVGEADYAPRAKQEYRRFIALLRKKCGPEPDGARLAIKAFDHDFGEYHEVVCWFDPDIPQSIEYAARCDNDAPATGEGYAWT